VSYWEVTDLVRRPGMSPHERWTGNGQFQAHCHFWCDWADRNTLIGEMAAENDGAGQLYPHSPEFGAYIYAANVVGWGRMSQNASDATLCDYDNALVTAFYSTEAPFFAGNKKFVTEEIRPTKYEYPVSHQGKTWTSTGNPVRLNDMPSMTLDSFEYRVTFHRLLSIPVGAYTLIGYTNSNVMGTYTLGMSFPAQSLYYPGPAIVGGIRMASLPMKTVTYALQFKRCPWTNTGAWNKHWDPAQNQFDTITDATYGQMVWKPLGDFSALVP
jgi:hypothetical protein